ncbi:MAG: hypothetical protein CFE40_04860 [Burkholderiales bacterium PBB1]|nr:MAG: hypothetical protein CFE40_04860 [Burkholderiales bacterium PBB1]
MFYALSWFFVVTLLALWSLVAWALHAIAVWTVSNAATLTGVASGADVIAVPGWLALWVPPEVAQWANRLMADVVPFVDDLLMAAPSLADGLNVATWVIWGIGSLLIVMLGAGLHLVIALWRRRGSSGTGPGGGSSLAPG